MAARRVKINLGRHRKKIPATLKTVSWKPLTGKKMSQVKYFSALVKNVRQFQLVTRDSCLYSMVSYNSFIAVIRNIVTKNYFRINCGV